MKKIILILISLVLFTLQTTYALSPEKIFKTLDEKPYDVDALFLASVVKYFQGDMQNSLQYYVKAVILDRNVISREDYGMVDSLLKFVKNILWETKDIELKVNALLFLDKLGMKKTSITELQRMISKIDDSEKKVILLRTLNSIKFMQTL